MWPAACVKSGQQSSKSITLNIGLDWNGFVIYCGKSIGVVWIDVD